MSFKRMLDYCRKLELNNNRPWFHANHSEYVDAKDDFEELVELTKYTVAENAPEIADGIMFTRPKDMMYRIPRDARMHRNKPPYNPSFRAYIASDRKSMMPIGYFMRIAHDECFFGTGRFCRDSARLNLEREYLLEHGDELTELLLESGYALEGEKLKNVPRGFPQDHPYAELAKFKYVEVCEYFTPEELGDFDDFLAIIGETVRRMEPLRQFLYRMALSSDIKKFH